MDRLACLAVNLFTGLTDKDALRYRSAENLPAGLFDFHWTRNHVESLMRVHASRREVRLVHTALTLVAQDSVIEQFVALAADFEEREDRTLLPQKLKKLIESLQRASQVTQ